ncbi:hypothetical protein QMO14_17085 [Variovorax sp. CAN2819]|uniref:hypothetical protein n=1 Tax=Variovorax sp. CAN15 TaxID=3046727 RepID=UPI0026499102|nr:hypothetical protein [Variovorax sp. CAN15]MDN6885323.1 hypothetical protein [Variovorax sp. CAN15]
MSERELVSLAAQAIGLAIEWQDCEVPRALYQPTNGSLREWRPLHDDGDALRLAIALAERICNVVCISIGLGRSGCEFTFVGGPDQGVNTRRSIVEAAAKASGGAS